MVGTEAFDAGGEFVSTVLLAEDTGAGGAEVLKCGRGLWTKWMLWTRWTSLGGGGGGTGAGGRTDNSL
jgi:hypothetical protein